VVVVRPSLPLRVVGRPVLASNAYVIVGTASPAVELTAADLRRLASS
jgi:hypothetical protein